jgi:hypothetical protein
MTRRNRAHAVERTARHIRSAQELVDRQKNLIAKFESEGLDVTSERYLLDSLQNVLTRDEARMGRLVYEDGLERQDKKKRSRQ